MSDLTERLQHAFVLLASHHMIVSSETVREAIDELNRQGAEITRLRAENAELRKAAGEPSWRYAVNGMRQAAGIAAGCTTGDVAAKTIRREALRIESVREGTP